MPSRLSRPYLSPPIALLLAVLLVAAACTGDGAPDPAGSAGPTGTAPTSPVSVGSPEPGELARAACALPPEQLARIVRGSPPDRVGDVLIVPKEPNFMDGGLSHSGPWDYLQRVPFLLYGPGYIRGQGSVDRDVTLADIAPTFAELLDFEFDAPDGRLLSGALVPREERPGPEPPRLIVTVVWDAGGRVVLDAHPGSWPVLEGMIPGGTWYENGTVGSSPSVTAPIHANLGTGAFPIHHKVGDSQVRIGQAVQGAWQQGPAVISVPALADLYDLAMGNEPKIGAVATLSWHLAMIGHGRMWNGGDADLAVLRQKGGEEGAETVVWNLPPKLQGLYELPGYVNDLPDLSTYFDEVDRLDGTPDGTWRGHDFADEHLRGGFHTPARIPYQTRLVQEIIDREGFGADDVPDLLFVNYKIIDEVGHAFGVNTPEMRDTVVEQDRYLGELVELLDDRVGEDRWVLFVTADHGHVPDPDLTGAVRISVPRLVDNLQATFDLDDDDVPVVVKVRPTQIYLNTAELEEHGFTVEQVAGYVLYYTRGRGAKRPEDVPPEAVDEKVFSAAFPTTMLEDLPCLPEDGG
ncbi:MAG: alkaline phosphatase family protein [Actinobacteria bacterium]|nr:alkaline phosphatase family protein [Actinomycetota bacterium]